jgi:hypothetical protein
LETQTISSAWTETGLEVLDTVDSPALQSRRPHERDMAKQMEAMQRIAQAFVEEPLNILQELVNSALDLCNADSAGISLEKEDGTDDDFYHWIATAGQYSDFLNAMLPRYPSACGVCLERGRPQIFRVGQPFFDIMGIEAPLVTDGILLPWEVDGTRGTIFIMAHGRTEAFDAGDCRVMEVLANFAAMGVRQQHQRKALMEQEKHAAAAAMANKLAHRINNPLQSLTNVLYLASEGYNGADAVPVGQQALADIEKLSALVKKLLALSYGD